MTAHGAAAAAAGLAGDAALRLRIEDLQTEYAHCIDDDRLEDWPGFFTDDGRYRIVTRENFELGMAIGLMYCDGKGMLEDRIAALRVANVYEPHVYRHVVGAARLLGEEAGAHRVAASFAVIRTMASGEMSVFGCGRYVDRIVEAGGGLRFAERIVVLDSRRVDTLLVVPI